MPLHIVSQRSVAAAFVYAFCAGAASTILIYYVSLLPLSVFGRRHTDKRSASAVDARRQRHESFAVRNPANPLPSRLRRLRSRRWPFRLKGRVLRSSNASRNGSHVHQEPAFLSTLSVSSTRAQYIGYQIVFAAGTGLGNNQPLTAVQTVLDDKDVPLGTSTVALAQTLGAAVSFSSCRGAECLCPPPAS